KGKGGEEPLRQSPVLDPYPPAIIFHGVNEVPDHHRQYQRLEEGGKVNEADHHQRYDEQPGRRPFYPDLADIKVGSSHRYNFSKYNGFEVYFWHTIGPFACHTKKSRRSMTTIKLRIPFIASALIIFLASCQSRTESSQGKQEQQSATEVAFTPNPQHVPEQEVATLHPGDVAPYVNLPDV